MTDPTKASDIMIDISMTDPTSIPQIKKLYWRNLLGAIVPKWLLPAIDREIKITTTWVVGNWAPMEACEWLQEIEATDVENLVYHNFEDYVPRYFKRPDHWVLILPTPVGNVLLHFDKMELPPTQKDLEFANKEVEPLPRRRVILAMPEKLSDVLERSLSDLDSFMSAFYHDEGGTVHDETVGRIVEQSCVDINNVLLWVIVVSSGIFSILYKLTNG